MIEPYGRANIRPPDNPKPIVHICWASGTGHGLLLRELKGKAKSQQATGMSAPLIWDGLGDGENRATQPRGK